MSDAFSEERNERGFSMHCEKVFWATKQHLRVNQDIIGKTCVH